MFPFNNIPEVYKLKNCKHFVNKKYTSKTTNDTMVQDGLINNDSW